jgi:prephenate dehydrogenase
MKKTGLIIGGNGALGRSFVSDFSSKGWKILSMDLSNNDNVTIYPIISFSLYNRHQAIS